MLRIDGQRIRTRVAAVVALLVLLSIVAFAPHAGAYARAVALFTDAVVRLPVRPLAWVIDDPSAEPLVWAGDGRGLLTLPGGGGPTPAIVLVVGADPAPPDDPRVERLTDALARVGFAVLLTQSGDLDAKRVLPVEPRRLAGAFEALGAHPRVDADRVGFVGLSAGGSLAIVAASDPRIADRVAFVLAIGPYFDAASLVASTLSQRHRLPDGREEAWEPHGTTIEVVRETVLAILPGGSVIDDRLAGDLAGDLARAEASIDALPAASRAMLEAVSPRYAVAGLRAPLYLLHDRDDPFVPWTESEALAAAVGPAVYHRIDLFEHVEPRIGNVRVLWRDGWRFVRLFAAIFEGVE